MNNFFQENVDRKRMETILDIKMRYTNNEITLEEGRNEIREKLGKITALEVAATEQELLKHEDDQCEKEDIQSMTELFVDLMQSPRPGIEEGHPILHYYMENDEARKILQAMEELMTKPVIKNQWYELYDELAKIRIHLSRKQNQLYSVLEKKGFTRPTTTMWTLDDFIRDEIRDTRALLEEDEEKFLAEQRTVIDDVLDLLEKEEKILYPTSLSMITKEEFEDMKEGDFEIGFAWISVEKPKTRAEENSTSDEGNDFMNDLNRLLSKYKMTSGNEELDVKTGVLSLEQINLIYQHMPVDLSYVDENEIVKFYTDTKHRIFPRSKNVIGRDVKNCHPKNSVHIVEEIIEKFRSGEQSEAEFWINKPEIFLYIKYVAIRDDKGKFRGVLEMMQDCTRIRKLEGSQTLLQWASESGDSVNETPAEASSDPKKIDENTRLQDLLNAYPGLKDELPKINPAFQMLHSPLAKALIPKATVKIMSERSEMNLDELIEKIQAYVDEKDGSL